MESNIEILNGDTFWAFMSWARYLAFADILREKYESSLELPDEAAAEEGAFAAFTPLLFYERSTRLQKDAAFAYYHSSLMPVIEGWKELSLSDEKVDALLLHEEGYYTSLRRYRNATFHYQREFFGPKHSGLYEKGQKMVLWIILLHSEFSRVYRQIVDDYPGTPVDTEAIRELVRDIVGWLPRTSQDLVREAERVERYLDEQLQHGTLSESSRQQALTLKVDVGALPSKSKEALSNIAALREVWRSHIFEEQASPSTLGSPIDTATCTDGD
jgi:hypothetical protein